jgi:hypothetical protein
VSSPRLRSIKLIGDEFPVPAQNSIWFGRGGYFLECLAAQPMADFSQSGPLSIRKLQTSFDLCLQDPIFSGEILIA